MSRHSVSSGNIDEMSKILARLFAENIDLDFDQEVDEAVRKDVDRIVWEPPANHIVIQMIRTLCSTAWFSPHPEHRETFCDEDVMLLVAAHVRAPHFARRAGIIEHRKQVADMVTEFFNDRARFTVPTVFVYEDVDYTFERQGDNLVVSWK